MLHHIRRAAAIMLALAPIAATAAETKKEELLDMRNWSEVALPGAPFQIDIPMPFKPTVVRESDSGKTTTWPTAYGFLNIKVEFNDRPDTASPFSPKEFLELYAGGILQNKTNGVADVTETTVAGYPAAKMMVEHDDKSGSDRMRTERLLVRVGKDDWSVETLRFAGGDGAKESKRVFDSIQKPSKPPALTPQKIGRLTVKISGKPKIDIGKLDAESAKTYEKWDTYDFIDPDGIGITIYNIRVKPEYAFEPKQWAQQLVDGGFKNGVDKPYVFSEVFAGYPGAMAQTTTADNAGEYAIRYLSVGDDREGWTFMMSGMNTARTAAQFREIIKSIEIAP